MDITKPGDIQNYCRPNGLLTFAEYLEDFATSSVYNKGWRLIDFYLKAIKDTAIRNKTLERLERIKKGERDLYF
jgi:2-iminoacetate synthase